MSKIFIILVLFLVSYSSFSQATNGKEIRDRDVEWSDFTGEVDTSSRFDAWTYWFTIYSFPAPKGSAEMVKINVKVRLFLRSDSWVKPDKKSDRLLKHEQGHYRIGRICANEIEKSINSMEFSRQNYKKEVDEIYWKIIKKYQEMNKQYDLETNHYRNRVQQEIWDKKLEQLLNSD